MGQVSEEIEHPWVVSVLDEYNAFLTQDTHAQHYPIPTKCPVQ